MTLTPRTRLAAIAAAMITALAGLFVPAPAQAHSVGSFFVSLWPDNANIAYGLNAGFPTSSDWRLGVAYGKDTWNVNGSGNEPNINWTLPDDVQYGTLNDPCYVPGLDKVIVHYASLDNYGVNVLGQVELCDLPELREIYTARMVLDSTRSTWYIGSSTTVPADKDDLRSTITHEWGHVLGWNGHIPEGDLSCPESSARSTMCIKIPIGTSWQRLLATHDIHTIDAAY